MPIPGKRQALRSGSVEVSPASPISETPEYDTCTSTTVCGGLHGGENGPAGGGPAMMVPVVCPLRTGKDCVCVIGVVTDCLLLALGWLPPPLTQAYTAVAESMCKVIDSVVTVLPSPASLKFETW